jgi:hypothetical protein
MKYALEMDRQGFCRSEARKMSSDLFLEAAKELDRCLTDKGFNHIIDSELRTEIQELHDRMEGMRIKPSKRLRRIKQERQN